MLLYVRTNIFCFYTLWLFFVINSAVGMVASKGGHSRTIQPIASDSYTTQVTEIVSPKDQPRMHKRIKVCRPEYSTNNFSIQDQHLTNKENTEEDNIVIPELKFEEDTVTSCFKNYTLDLYTQLLLLFCSPGNKRFINNARHIIPMYYEEALINGRGEYKIWGKKINLIQLSIQIANLERLREDLFRLYDEAYKNYLFSLSNKTNEVKTKIDVIFENPEKLSLNQLDFLPENNKMRQIDMLSIYFDDKEKSNQSLVDKLQYFCSIWQKMILKDLNGLLLNNQTNTNISVDNFIRQIKNINQLLDIVCLNLNGAIQEYAANGKKFTLNNIVDFNDSRMSDLKKLSIQATYRSLVSERNLIKQFFDNIDNLLKPLITRIRCRLGNTYSFKSIKSVSEPLTEELIPEISEYYKRVIIPQLIDLIVQNISFANQNFIQNYIDDLNIIKNGLELLEESLSYYRWG